MVTDGIPTEEQLNAVVGELGEDLTSLTFALNGHVYQLPVSPEDLFADGWYVKKDLQKDLETLAAYTRTTTVPVYIDAADGYGRGSIGVVFTNEISMERDLEETDIESFSFDRSSGVTLVLPQGITWNSTFDEIKEAYQLSDDVCIDEPDFLKITLPISGGHTVHIFFDEETRTPESITLK